ncbi:serine protease [Amorphoplanes nipponensis]|uniref:S1 family peptidase n=1 Tax=Actinoplanes nipponensis TaxID=135950 RepID=UPI0019404BF1|nr:trypsin-like serine protease [Actinoplanes nipponensis]
MTSRTWLGGLTAVTIASLLTVAPQPASAASPPQTAVPARAAVSATPSDDDVVSPFIIGGSDATEPYPFAARVLTTFPGIGTAKCTGTFVRTTRGRIGVVSNAHCFELPGDNQPAPLANVQVQAGSTHLDKLVTLNATGLQLHPEWDWMTGTDRVADVAVIILKIPAGLAIRAIPIADWARAYQKVRLLGWGKTTYDATQPPPVLQQLDTRLTASSACAVAGITAGELCVAAASNGGSPCFGDSGGPALRARAGSWALLGSASRGTDESTCTGAMIYTDATYYAGWIERAVDGKHKPHRPRPAAPSTTKRHWALAG